MNNVKWEITRSVVEQLDIISSHLVKLQDETDDAIDYLNEQSVLDREELKEKLCRIYAIAHELKCNLK